MIRLTKSGILAKKLLNGVRIIYALCGFDVWYEDNAKTSTVALVICALQTVISFLLAILTWTRVIQSNLDAEFESMDEIKLCYSIFLIVNIVSLVTYAVFRLTQFKNWRICGDELRRIDKNFEKFGIDSRTVGQDFCLFMILFLSVVSCGSQEWFDYIVLNSKAPSINFVLGPYMDFTNIFIDYILIGSIYLLYLRYQALNRQCFLLKELSDSIRYQIDIVKFIREQHQELSLLVERIVNIYKVPLILTIVRTTVLLITRMYLIFKLSPGLSDNQIIWVNHSMMLLISMQLLRIYIMCNISTSMTSEANQTSSILSYAESNNPYLYMRHERANLSLYLKQQNVRIRPFNMCEINYGLFTSIIGAILVYLFYFVDMSKKEQ